VIKLGDLDTFSRSTFFPLLNELFEPEQNRLNELVRQEQSRADRLSIVYNVLSVLSLVVGVMMIIAIVIAFNVSRNIINSVEHLIEASDAISRGDLDVPIDVSTGGDMQTLAESIERMRTSLKAAIERLRR
jgi:nitrogen fixation/metabolism regulation signal transduction histidine kinase